MDEKETYEILHYKRPCDCWLCPDCDTENEIVLGKCSVCGRRKDALAVILKQWNEAEEQSVTCPIVTPTRETPPPEDRTDGSNAALWWIVFAIFVLGLIVIATQG